MSAYLSLLTFTPEYWSESDGTPTALETGLNDILDTAECSIALAILLLWARCRVWRNRMLGLSTASRSMTWAEYSRIVLL